ncbi:hypothetical protein LTR62_000459 [Meristemomyces frigidus]|uniref:PH domain-containing protein n=1 Tax=Meristemomyces frigidus TaxID=1508187 RepID=A0AAN7TLJ0_9PEZI|nr:hypothetical protein LTR62_000459 [Meristemomyces frigidus]
MSTEPIIPAPEHHQTAAPVTSTPLTDATPATTSEPLAATHEPALAPLEETKDVASPVAAAETSVEPITEGQLAYKGPGLIKSLLPSKKEFWLSDAPVTPQHLHLYTRGEKPEVSDPVVAWASQTGKGLLFFNKKGEMDRSHPHSVLPLYEAVDLKKSHPHSISFRIHGQEHTLKAANDAEANGWFSSLERAVEVGKAEKETVHASEGYKAEHERLTKPALAAAGVAGAAGATAAARSKSHSKTTDGEVRRAGSDSDGNLEKKKKSRSTSRGMLNKLTGKKEEREEKKEEKREEKEEKKEEKHEIKEEKKLEKEEHNLEKQELQHEKAEAKHEHHAAEAGLIGGTAVPLDAPSTGKLTPDVRLTRTLTFTADRVLAAPLVDEHSGFAGEATPVSDATTTSALGDSKKPAKRASIFGRMQSGFSSIKSPTKEKDFKDAELKPEVPPKDIGVSETAPQIPEPTSETGAVAPVHTVDSPVESSAIPAEASKSKLDEVSAAQEPKKSGFLSGLPFMNKRDRSVSPSAAMKDAPKHEAAPVLPVHDASTLDPRSEEPIKAGVEPTTASSAVVVNGTEKPVETLDEPTMANNTTEVTTPSADNKRQSMFGNFGNLGRRASKAFRGMSASPSGSPIKQENAVPASTTVASKDVMDANNTTPAAAAAFEEPTINGTHSAVVEPEHTLSHNGVLGDVPSDSNIAGQAHTMPAPNSTVTASA